MRIPKSGNKPELILEKLKEAKDKDVDWEGARNWSLVYYAGKEHTDFLKEVSNLFFSENAAGISMFPSLQNMEARVVSMLASLLGGTDDTAGTMTSGGTESILLAMKAYRDQAREERPDIKTPEILVPASAHPAFNKAAQYLDLKLVSVPIDRDFQVDISELRKSISEQTICMIASAPTFPQGVMDPIAEMGEIAKANEMGLHIDACLGGFMLPFIKNIGFQVPMFDFQVPGVTSISTDLHKYAYAAKGASAILYKDSSLRRYQFSVFPDWAGGVYASPTMMGTRPAGPIASAWAALMVQGEDGYIDIARRTMAVTQRLIAGIRSLKHFHILGNPVMSVFSFNSSTLDMHKIGDRMATMKWQINRQNNPDALHMIVTINHEAVVDEFLSDLEKATVSVSKLPLDANSGKSAVLYGGAETLAQSTSINTAAIQRIEDSYKL